MRNKIPIALKPFHRHVQCSSSVWAKMDILLLSGSGGKILPGSLVATCKYTEELGEKHPVSKHEIAVSLCMQGSISLRIPWDKRVQEIDIIVNPEKLWLIPALNIDD